MVIVVMFYFNDDSIKANQIGLREGSNHDSSGICMVSHNMSHTSYSASAGVGRQGQSFKPGKKETVHLIVKLTFLQNIKVTRMGKLTIISART